MYHILHKDGELVGVVNTSTWVSLEGVSVISIDEPCPDLNKVTWQKNGLYFEPIKVPITRLEFMSRFTSTERISAQASADPIIQDALRLLNIAEFIDTTDERTSMFVQYLAMVGIISANRVQEILA